MSPIVLVVDDDCGVLRLAVLVLSAHGYEVLTATRGPEALRIARRRAPKVILLDMVLPEVDGLGVLRALAADPAMRSIPVVAMSGFFEPGQLPASFGGQCVGFIEKPITPDTFLEEIRLALAS